MKNKIINVGWSEIEVIAEQLSEKLKPIADKKLVAVARGGLVPTALLSHLLDVRHIDVIAMKTYNGKEQSDYTEFFKLIEGDGGGYIFIDDLSDTGKSFKILREKFPNAHYATLYVKPMGREYVDTYVREYEQNEWIVFPWERD